MSVAKCADGETNYHQLQLFTVRQDVLEGVFQAAIYGMGCMLQDYKTDKGYQTFESWETCIDSLLIDLRTTPTVTPEMLEFVKAMESFKEHALASSGQSISDAIPKHSRN